MEEKDYIELQMLLAKLRVICLKEIGNKDLDPKEREKQFKLVRSIDNIRTKMPLNLDTENNQTNVVGG